MTWKYTQGRGLEDTQLGESTASHLVSSPHEKRKKKHINTIHDALLSQCNIFLLDFERPMDGTATMRNQAHSRDRGSIWRVMRTDQNLCTKSFPSIKSASLTRTVEAHKLFVGASSSQHNARLDFENNQVHAQEVKTMS